MLPIIEIRNLSKEYRLGRSLQRNENFREFLKRKLSAPVHALNGSKAAAGSNNNEKDRRVRAQQDVSANVANEQLLGPPVKQYSSGMYVRLAFAVAAHLNPEILVVDEVLAVGDAAFQKKCLGKMNAVSRGGRTVLFVSHNMAAVENLCQRGIVLERGRAVFDGSSKDAVHHYLTSFSGMPDSDGHIIDLSAASRISVVGQLLKRMELYTDEDRP